jgi:Ca2+-binding EF-hand superfamily protein
MKNKNIQKTASRVFAGATLGLALACGGGGTSGTGSSFQSSALDSVDSQNIGFFIDSAVSGIEYQSGQFSGITDEFGRFQYEDNATIRFKIGDIVLGEGVASETMTPIDIIEGANDESNNAVINILRLLQTLDSDGDPENGIDISEDTLQRLRGSSNINFDQESDDFEYDGNINRLMSLFQRKLIDSDSAKDHFRESRERLKDEKDGFKKQDGLSDGENAEERFKNADLNSDELLDLVEFESDMEKRTPEKIDTFFTHHDSDENGVITLEEMQIDSRRDKKHINKDQVEEKFNIIDSDQDQRIDRKEFENHLFERLPERAKEIFERLDTDSDERVSLEEIENKTKNKKSHSERMVNKFDNIDLDEDGLLSLNEFLSGAPEDRREQASEHFKTLDSDNNGSLTKDEFWVKKLK